MIRAVLFLTFVVATSRSQKADIPVYKTCGNISLVETSETRLQSPGHPEKYKGNLNCWWTIGEQYQQSAWAKVYIESLDIEKSNGCQFDHLNVQFSGQEWTKYCGKNNSLEGRRLIEGKTPVKVNFGSDDSVSGSGFSLVFEVELPCKFNPCMNGGKCVQQPSTTHHYTSVNGTNDSVQIEKYTCDCADGWIGTNCEQRNVTEQNTTQFYTTTIKQTTKIDITTQKITTTPKTTTTPKITTKPETTTKTTNKITTTKQLTTEELLETTPKVTTEPFESTTAIKTTTPSKVTTPYKTTSPETDTTTFESTVINKLFTKVDTTESSFVTTKELYEPTTIPETTTTEKTTTTKPPTTTTTTTTTKPPTTTTTTTQEPTSLTTTTTPKTTTTTTEPDTTTTAEEITTASSTKELEGASNSTSSDENETSTRRRVSVVMGAVFSSVALVTIIVASIRLRKKCKNSKVDAA